MFTTKYLKSTNTSRIVSTGDSTALYIGEFSATDSTANYATTLITRPTTNYKRAHLCFSRLANINSVFQMGYVKNTNIFAFFRNNSYDGGNGLPLMSFDCSNNYVGINRAIPDGELDISGTLYADTVWASSLRIRYPSDNIFLNQKSTLTYIASGTNYDMVIAIPNFGGLWHLSYCLNFVNSSSTISL